MKYLIYRIEGINHIGVFYTNDYDKAVTVFQQIVDAPGLLYHMMNTVGETVIF